VSGSAVLLEEVGSWSRQVGAENRVRWAWAARKVALAAARVRGLAGVGRRGRVR
jgi:hypothetical protein